MARMGGCSPVSSNLTELRWREFSQEVTYNKSPRSLLLRWAFFRLPCLEACTLSMIPAAPSLVVQPFIAAVNHLLIREAWARERLGRFAGKTAQLAAPPFSVDFLVRDDGLLAPLPRAAESKSTSMSTSASTSSKLSGSGVESKTASDTLPPLFDVTLTMPREAVPEILRSGQAAAMKYVRIEGDADFAAAIGYLAENLRWEPEEDLARVIGDAAAYRIGGVVRAGAAQFERAGRNLVESITEYLVDENRQLVRAVELNDLRADLTETRDDLARLEKRLERLERSQGRMQAVPRGEPT
jgi:ubiquinone biosynthesis protein UbiJ